MIKPNSSNIILKPPGARTDLVKTKSSSFILQVFCAVLFALFALLISIDQPGTTLSAAADLEGWTYSTRSSGVDLYTKSIPGSRMLGVRGVTEVEGVLGMPEIMTTFFDISLSKKWVADLAEVRLGVT